MVESEKREHLRRGGELLVGGRGVFVVLRLFLILGDMLAVQALDHVHVDGDPTAVSVARPLRVLLWSAQARRCAKDTHHQSCSLIDLDIEVLVQFLYLLLLAPFLGVCELAVCSLDVELSCSQVASANMSASCQDRYLEFYLQKGAIVVAGFAIQARFRRRPPAILAQQLFELV